MRKVLSLFVLLVAALVGIALYMCPCLLKEPKVPQMPSHRWWGAGEEPPGASQARIESRPFRIHVEDSVLRDLKQRLQSTRLSPPLEGVAFQYGYNTDHLKTVLDYWKNKYDWRKEESRLNQFPQFLAKIEGIDVHYIRVTPSVKDPKVKVLPLLMVHGWPGSVVEFYKILPLLTAHVDGVAFEVICPSIPGYGFSEAPHHPGFNAAEAARIFAKLMEHLGHDKFYVQGGDWGSMIVDSLSVLYPEKVLGLHCNMVVGAGRSPIAFLKYILSLVVPSLIVEDTQKYNIYPPGQLLSTLLQESGYFHIQATKPDTVGVGLGDSPAGLAAYLLEKFSTATNIVNREKRDGGLLEAFTMDELLTNIMVYWVTNTITSSVRFYKENVKASGLRLDSFPVLVPSGIAVFPHEILTVPRTILSHKYPNLLTYNHMKRGGHFAALEEPELLSDDIRAFVSACEAQSTFKEATKEKRAASGAPTGTTAKPVQAEDQQRPPETRQKTTTPIPTNPTKKVEQPVPTRKTSPAKEASPSKEEERKAKQEAKKDGTEGTPKSSSNPSSDKQKERTGTKPETSKDTVKTEPKPDTSENTVRKDKSPEEQKKTVQDKNPKPEAVSGQKVRVKDADSGEKDKTKQSRTGPEGKSEKQ